MDNMLIDHENCKKVFDELNNINIKEVQFIWGCNKKNFMTLWVSEKSWHGASYLETSDMSGYDFTILCRVTDEKATFEVIHKEP